MHRYRDNAKWLLWLAPFRGLSISAAYVTPFLVHNGLSLAQVFGLQSIFSVAYLLWEIPSGLIADRYGRAFSIKLSGPIAAAGTIAYGFSTHFWQFVICELMLALANGFVSGVDDALLIDSLRADLSNPDQLRQAYTRSKQRINAAGFAAVVIGAPIAYLLVKYLGLGSTIWTDGILTGIGAACFSLRLVEAPRSNGGQIASRLSAFHALKGLTYNVEARWIVVLATTLAGATYLAFWLTAPYLQGLGLPAVWFSTVLAVRSGFKSGLSLKFHQKRHLERNLLAYTSLTGITYLAMATGQVWLAPLLLGHDVVQALAAQPLTARLNIHIEPDHRATLNSAVNLVQRLAYSVAGPLVGLVADHATLGLALVTTGLVSTAIGLLALGGLHQLKIFREGA